MIELARLHRRLVTLMALASLVAFLSGAGLESPFAVITGLALLSGLFFEPSERWHRPAEWAWRILAVVLAARALYFVISIPEDVVLPLVDVLLVLLASEAMRPTSSTDRSRMYTLSFAVIVAAAAYRAGVAFGLAFIVYSTSAVVALVVGHTVHESVRFGVRPPALEKSFLWRVAALSGVMLFMSGLLFIAFPRVTRSWVSRGAPQLATSIVGFSDRVSLAEHGGRIYPNPEIVLRVEFPDQLPPQARSLYWRGRSYDHFDGESWRHSRGAGSLSVPVLWYRDRWPQELIRPKVYAAPLDVPVLFAPHPTLGLFPHSRLSWFRDPTGDIWSELTGRPAIYATDSRLKEPSDAELAASSAPPMNPTSPYLQLPQLSSAVSQLADSLTRGATTEIERVRAVERWLRTDFRYTLNLPATARQATLEYFLFRRKAGHCEYFSTAMVILLRSAGIPARNVNGFLGGDWNTFGNFLTVTQNQAHSWVEVWFPHYGWVQFDPTPATTGDVAAAQRNWLGPFRFLVDGLEHRWNKWILEYNLEAQIEVFRRTADAFTTRRAEPGAGRRPKLPVRVLLPYAFAGFALVVAFRLIRRRGRASDPGAAIETKHYLRFRRVYQKAGYGGEHLTPLAFLRALEHADAPATEAARELVELYLSSRFGGVDIGDVGRERMKKDLVQVRGAVKRKRRAA